MAMLPASSSLFMWPISRYSLPLITQLPLCPLLYWSLNGSARLHLWTFFDSFKTSIKAKPWLLSNLWGLLLLTYLKKNKLFFFAQDFLNSLIHLNYMRQFLATRDTYECLIVKWICEWVNLDHLARSQLSEECSEFLLYQS